MKNNEPVKVENTKKLSLSNIKQESKFKLVDEKYGYYSILVLIGEENFDRTVQVQIPDIFHDKLLVLVLSYINARKNRDWILQYIPVEPGSLVEEFDKPENTLIKQVPEGGGWYSEDYICGCHYKEDLFFPWLGNYIDELVNYTPQYGYDILTEIRQTRIENYSLREYEVILPSLEELFDTPGEAIKYINDLYEK